MYSYFYYKSNEENNTITPNTLYRNYITEENNVAIAISDRYIKNSKGSDENSIKSSNNFIKIFKKNSFNSKRVI